MLTPPPTKRVLYRYLTFNLWVMKQLSNKVSIVPVIAKADCLTQKEISQLKKTILGEIKEHGIKVYTLPECDR